MNSADALDRQVYNVVLFTLIPFVVAFSFIVFVLYRRRRESSFRLKEAQFNRQVAEVEMKALRAQINPHFIFNCMNSVQEFMAKNDVSHAQEYLENFTVLIRMVLENSVHKLISLKEDMDTLSLFMKMENARMKFPFGYQIEIDKEIDASSVLVPPLVLQPFVENSIKHGFSGKDSEGMISIHVQRDGDLLKFIICDNGIEQQHELKNNDVKKTSLGLSLTRERLDVISKEKNTKAYFIISDIRHEDNVYAGKKAELFLPYEEAY